MRAEYRAADTILENLERRFISGNSVDGAEDLLDPDIVDTLQEQWTPPFTAFAVILLLTQQVLASER